MAPDDRQDAPTPGHPPLAATLLGIWNTVVDGLGALGTVMIGVLMCLICADVLARNLASASLPMIAELGALTLVMIVYLQLATTIRHDRLARTELVWASLRAGWPRAGAVVGGVYNLAAAGLLGVIAWSTLTIVQRDFTRGEYIGVTGIATLPTWPFRVLILTGMVVATVQCVVQVVTEWRAATRGRAT